MKQNKAVYYKFLIFEIDKFQQVYMIQEIEEAEFYR